MPDLRFPMVGWVFTSSTLLLALSGWGHCDTPPSPSAEPVEVELRSGRVFRALVDPRTSDETLWLRFSRSIAGELTILRPVRWDTVKTVRHHGREIPGDQFRSTADELKERTPKAVFSRSSAPVLGAVPLAYSPGAPWSCPDCVLSDAAILPPSITHFDIDAFVSNWDGDVEVDGIELHVFPRTVEGIVVPLGGSLEVTLIGAVAEGAEPRYPFPEIGRWTQALGPDRFGPGGAVFRLPFQGVHPDFDLEVAPQAVLHVRLTAPGHGTFETSAANLRIRPYSGMRDRLEQHENRRFFSGERTRR